VSVQKPTSGVSAIVLAAGMSQRMGTPKQLLRIEGKPILERTLTAVRESAISEIVLVLGFAADAVEKQVSTQGLKVVRNETYQQGMGTSLRAGLAAVDPESSAALIVLGDQPFVRPTTLNHLIECHRSSKAQIVIPLYMGFRGNPVLLDRAVFPEIAQLSGDVGCRAIFGNHTEGIHKLAVDDPGILLDIDSLEDIQKLDQVSAGVSRGLAPLETREGATPQRPALVLVGRDSVVRALAKLGQLLRFNVTIVDPFLRLQEVAEADRILHVLDFSMLPPVDERYAVIASRGQFDEEGLCAALKANASYIGLLAGKSRGQELANGLLVQGFTKEEIARIHVPAGLEIGAESSEEIALSIMAEILSERKRNQHGDAV
jgi:molybdenum cofactor cytidylyltransferase